MILDPCIQHRTNFFYRQQSSEYFFSLGYWTIFPTNMVTLKAVRGKNDRKKKLTSEAAAANEVSEKKQVESKKDESPLVSMIYRTKLRPRKKVVNVEQKTVETVKKVTRMKKVCLSRISTPIIGPSTVLQKKHVQEKVATNDRRSKRKNVVKEVNECTDEKVGKRIKVEDDVDLLVTQEDLEGKTDTDEQKIAVRQTLFEFLKCFAVAVEEEKKREDLAKELSKKVSKRPDLKACTMMRAKGLMLLNGKKVIGRVRGTKTGDCFFSRTELCVLNLHNHWLNGIDYIPASKENPYGKAVCSSIIISGGYEDDKDKSEEVWYTGSGKNDLVGNKRQYGDQELTKGNLALMNSKDTQNPIRVFRGFRASLSGMKTYTFDGMYQVVDSKEKLGKSKFKVFQFLMRRMPGQPALTSDQVDFLKGQGIPKTAKDCQGFVTSDISMGKEKVPIAVTNIIDRPKEPPKEFTYITERVWPKNMKEPEAPKGCNCEGVCDPKTCSCRDPSSHSFNFNGSKRLTVARGAILECGPNCKCSAECTNRNAQHGIRFRLELYRTALKGWALRSWDNIPIGSIVAPYIGEVLHEDNLTDDDVYVLNLDTMKIGSQGTDVREAKSNDIEKLSKKLLNDSGNKEVQKNNENCQWVLDAKDKGNIARFFNHSCDPNMFYQSVIWDHNDLNFSVPVLIASKNIPAMTELTYDYGYVIGSVKSTDGKIEKLECHCGANGCRKRLY